MLDHLILMNIFHIFAFCTRTCNIDGICRFRTRILHENSDVKKCRQIFVSFDICNLNHDFISINETKKQGCLFFKTCNDQKDIWLVFKEILLRIYLNLTKNTYKIFTKKYNHFYCLEFFNVESFSQAYCLICKFFLHKSWYLSLYLFSFCSR